MASRLFQYTYKCGLPWSEHLVFNRSLYSNVLLLVYQELLDFKECCNFKEIILRLSSIGDYLFEVLESKGLLVLYLIKEVDAMKMQLDIFEVMLADDSEKGVELIRSEYETCRRGCINNLKWCCRWALHQYIDSFNRPLSNLLDL